MGLSERELERELDRARDELRRRPGWRLRDSCRFIYGGHVPSPRGVCRRCGTLLASDLAKRGPEG